MKPRLQNSCSTKTIQEVVNVMLFDLHVVHFTEEVIPFLKESLVISTFIFQRVFNYCWCLPLPSRQIFGSFSLLLINSLMSLICRFLKRHISYTTFVAEFDLVMQVACLFLTFCWILLTISCKHFLVVGLMMFSSNLWFD